MTDDTLSRRQHMALASLLSGASIIDAAKAAGVNRNTVTKWLALPAFWQALSDASAQALRLASVASASDMDDALATVREVMTDTDAPPALRLRAAIAMLDVRLRLLDVLDFATRLDELERQVKVIYDK